MIEHKEIFSLASQYISLLRAALRQILVQKCLESTLVHSAGAHMITWSRLECHSALPALAFHYTNRLIIPSATFSNVSGLVATMIICHHSSNDATIRTVLVHYYSLFIGQLSLYFPPWQQSCGQDLGGQQHQKSLFGVASFELEMICKLIQHNLNGWHLHCSINHFKLVDWDQEGIVKSARPCHFSKAFNRLIYEFHQCLEVFQFRVEFPLKFNFQPFVWESMITICEILFQQWFSCSDDKSEGVNVIENRSFYSAVLKGSKRLAW